MKKILAVLLVLALSVSICSTAFGATIIGFEDQVSYNKTAVGSQYYRKSRVSIENDIVKFGNYSGKITASTYYFKGDAEAEAGYVLEFSAFMDVHKLEIEDESLFDMYFYFPVDCNIDTVTIKALDKNQEEIISIDVLVNEEEGTWLSLYEYWGESLDHQDNMDINSIFYLGFYGVTLDGEKEASFYVDNIFFGSESEHEKYLENPAAAVPVVDSTDTNVPGDSSDPTTDVNDNNDTTDDEGSGLDTTTIVWIAVAAVIAVALVAAIVLVVKKKK